ncbi:MAG: hypothetical protein WAM73_02780 [Desulfobacterales bacterium]
MKRKKKSNRKSGFWSKAIEEGRSVNFIWTTAFIKTFSANGGMSFQPIIARHLVQSIKNGIPS